MKRICLFLFLGFLLASCQKKKEILLPAEEIYMIAFNYDFLNAIDTNNHFNVKTISHINNQFMMNIFSRNSYKGDYYHTSQTFADSIKIKLSEIINFYDNDSIFELEEDYALIYDGPTYLFLIKKESKDDYIRLSGIPHTFPDDLNFFRSQIGSNPISCIEKLANNQDSLKQEIRKFEKYALDALIFKEFAIPPPNPSIKFIPPIIDNDE